MGERGCVLFAGGGAALWRLRRQSPPCGRRGGSAAAAAPRVPYTAFARCSAPQATVFRCRSEHGPGRKRRHAIEPGRSVYGNWGRTACPKARLRGIPQSSGGKTAGTCAPGQRSFGCGSGRLRLQIKKPPMGASYASFATGSAWVRNAMHPPK